MCFLVVNYFLQLNVFSSTNSHRNKINLGIMIILPAIKLFTLQSGQLFFSHVFRQDIALKCLDILSTLVTSHPQHLHRVFRLLLPFALISKPSSSYVTFARAVVTSLLQHRSVGDFDWSKSAASMNLYNSMLLRHNFCC